MTEMTGGTYARVAGTTGITQGGGTLVHIVGGEQSGTPETTDNQRSILGYNEAEDWGLTMLSTLSQNSNKINHTGKVRNVNERDGDNWRASKRNGASPEKCSEISNELMS